ncbi:MAG: metal ABC transporter ATP-binding protein [Deltaproteobacteria bacterium]
MAAADSSALIELKNVTLGYDSAVLRSVNLSIRRGERWGIIGPNGGGKTTLLKTIIGLIPPLAGSVESKEKLVFGYVPQRDSFDSLFPLSTLEVVSMGRYSRVRVGGRLNNEDLSIVHSALVKLGIERLARHPFRSLSGGEKQRALLARALAGEPDILALDEPTASVDLKGELQIMETVNSIKIESNLAVIIVSHYLGTVARFADRAALADKDNQTFLSGGVREVITSEVLSGVFGLDAFGMRDAR